MNTGLGLGLGYQPSYRWNNICVLPSMYYCWIYVVCYIVHRVAFSCSFAKVGEVGEVHYSVPQRSWGREGHYSRCTTINTIVSYVPCMLYPSKSEAKSRGHRYSLPPYNLLLILRTNSSQGMCYLACPSVLDKISREIHPKGCVILRVPRFWIKSAVKFILRGVQSCVSPGRGRRCSLPHNTLLVLI